jgi:hypothetical protein
MGAGLSSTDGDRPHRQASWRRFLQPGGLGAGWVLGECASSGSGQTAPSVPVS